MEIDEVVDRDTFRHYLKFMRTELRAELKGDTEQWANLDLPTFLEAMERWVADWQKPHVVNIWQHAAILITMGALYE